MKITTHTVGAKRTRVLLALLHIYAKNGRATIREVADGAGFSFSATYNHLKHLRTEGMVDWEDGTFGTLRPLVEEVPDWLESAAS